MAYASRLTHNEPAVVAEEMPVPVRIDGNGIALRAFAPDVFQDKGETCRVIGLVGMRRESSTMLRSLSLGITDRLRERVL